MKGKVELVGGKELQAMLAGIPADVEREALTKGLRDGANLVLREAKARVPVWTGALRKGLRVKMLTKKKGQISALVGGDRQSGGAHAHLVEFGTQPHPIPTTIRIGNRELTRVVIHRGSRPRPFLFPAFESQRRNVIETVKRSVQAVLDKRAKK